MNPSPMSTEEELDAGLKACSDQLFELDEISKRILACIARGGPQNRHELEKNSHVRRSVIARHIKGSKEIPSLLDLEYVRVVAELPFTRKKNTMMKYYGLTFKGVLASLCKVNMKDSYFFRTLVNVQNRLNQVNSRGVQGLKIRSQSVMEIKRITLIFFLHHSEQKMKLTHARNFPTYFSDFCSTIKPPNSRDQLYLQYLGARPILDQETAYVIEDIRKGTLLRRKRHETVEDVLADK